MSILTEIQNAAVASDSDLASLLRKCKVLAFQLSSTTLEEWIVHEANGYPDNVTIPDYRIFPMGLKGNFFGPFGSKIVNAPIPTLALEEKLRIIDKFTCRQSIHSIELMLKESSDGVLHVPLDDFALYLGTSFYKGYNCAQAWGELGRIQFTEVVNAVRNRILDFVLRLGKERTGLMDAVTVTGSLEPSRVTQIFNTTIWGGSTNILGAALSSDVEFNVTVNDTQSLQEALGAQGLDQKDVKELEDSLKADPAPNCKGKFGPSVSKWIGKMMQKAASGAWNVAVDVAASVLTKALNQYYGLGD